jgi:tRNA wybutosine-synthesizing protein 1
VFCWRATPETLGVSWEQTQIIDDPEEPDKIIDGCIEGHRKALSGFGGNPNVSKEMLEEAMNPIHAAISLEGEATLYPLLGELVDTFFSRGYKSVFIVSNGTNPKVLENLSRDPSQLYISLCAPDEETYKKTCRPIIQGGWDRVMATLDLLESFNCPTVLRHTLIPGLNMVKPEEYVRLAEHSNATYLEPKAAMSVGAARDRFGYDDMAWFEDIRVFAEKMADTGSYKIIDEHRWSNIVLLSRLDEPVSLY